MGYSPRSFSRKWKIMARSKFENWAPSERAPSKLSENHKIIVESISPRTLEYLISLCAGCGGLVLRLSDGGVLSSSNEICRFLCAESGRDDLCGGDPFRQALVDYWLGWEAGQLKVLHSVPPHTPHTHHTHTLHTHTHTTPHTHTHSHHTHPELCPHVTGVWSSNTWSTSVSRSTRRSPRYRNWAESCWGHTHFGRYCSVVYTLCSISPWRSRQWVHVLYI